MRATWSAADEPSWNSASAAAEIEQPSASTTSRAAAISPEPLPARVAALEECSRAAAMTWTTSVSESSSSTLSRASRSRRRWSASVVTESIRATTTVESASTRPCHDFGDSSAATHSWTSLGPSKNGRTASSSAPASPSDRSSWSMACHCASCEARISTITPSRSAGTITSSPSPDRITGSAAPSRPWSRIARTTSMTLPSTTPKSSGRVRPPGTGSGRTGVEEPTWSLHACRRVSAVMRHLRTRPRTTGSARSTRRTHHDRPRCLRP